MTDQLAALRAEVVALRDEAGSRVPDPLDRPWDTRYATLTAVLDLIDKHAREGQ